MVRNGLDCIIYHNFELYNILRDTFCCFETPRKQDFDVIIMSTS